MLGDQAGFEPENDDIARTCFRGRDTMEMSRCGREQGLFARGFRPITRVCRRSLGIESVEIAPYSAHEAQAVSAYATLARLMVIRRSDPGACGRYDLGA